MRKPTLSGKSAGWSDDARKASAESRKTGGAKAPSWFTKSGNVHAAPGERNEAWRKHLGKLKSK